jgi:hypothetical protein
MWIAAVIAVLIVLAVLYMASRSRYYARLFSAESFREFHGGLSKGIEIAQRKNPDEPPSLDDGTAFVTGPGLAVAVTCTRHNGFDELHISLSQAGQVTTHALCSRFSFFAAIIVGDTKGELTPYYTESGVHHLVFRNCTPSIPLRNFDSTYARYLSDYTPVPFRCEKINDAQARL